jgi:hypothetical protein
MDPSSFVKRNGMQKQKFSPYESRHSRNNTTNFVAAPSNDSKLILKRNETAHSQAERKKAKTLETNLNADLNDNTALP